MKSLRFLPLVLTIAIVSSAGCRLFPVQEHSSESIGMTVQEISSACQKDPGETPQNPRTGKYRTIISSEMKEEPNFAGCWRVVEIGCGTSCQQIVLLHPGTETVLWGPTASYGAKHRLDSNILVVNPPEVLKANNAESLDWATTRRYRLDHEGASLHSLKNR